jgi:hypothetical protein
VAVVVSLGMSLQEHAAPISPFCRICQRFVQRVRIESSGHFSHLVIAAFLRTRLLWQSRRRPERDDHTEPAARVLATVIMLDHVRGDEGLQSERTKVVA